MPRQGKKLSICAIVVSFNPDTAVLISLLQQIGTQGEFLLIDNASANIDNFRAVAESTPRCLGVRVLESNIGLASALNLGIEEAARRGFGFVVLFDQDSQVPVSFFANLYASYVEASRLSPRPVAAVGPRITHPGSGAGMPFKLFSRWIGRTDRPLPGSNRLSQAEFLISSGCLIPLQALEQIGPMRDAYFIDNVDLEWCFRARARGYVMVGTDNTTLFHRIGEASDEPLVRAGLMVQHSPLRSYYSTRNRFALYREPYAPWGWKLRDFPRFLLKAAWLLLFSPQRGEYWANIRRGLADAGSVR